MRIFGTLPTGEEIYEFTLRSGDASASIISYGATLRSLRVFGREVVAGFDTLDDYMQNRTFHGATVGRVCNRIVGGTFTMDGRTYELTKNNGGLHCLHGGSDGYSNKAWEVLSHADRSVTLGYTSPDGQSGFPGEVRIEATYTLTGTALTVHYRAVPKAKTPIMLTNHAYFNLGGFGCEVLNYTLKVYAEDYSEVGADRLPTGRRVSVAQTPLDFSSPRRIGERMAESPIGYDHNFVISPTSHRESEYGKLGLAAEVRGEGICLKAYTNQPGVQLYVPKSEVKTPLRGGVRQIAYGAFCLEAQIEPDCVSRGIGFVDAGEVYESTTVYEATRE